MVGHSRVLGFDSLAHRMIMDHLARYGKRVLGILLLPIVDIHCQIDGGDLDAGMTQILLESS